MMSYASRMMSKQKTRDDINITSIWNETRMSQTAYSNSKGAVAALIKLLQKLGTFGVRVNSVAPGFIDLNIFRSEIFKNN